MAIFVLITEANKKNNMALARVPYIHYPLHFYKDKKNKIKVLINFISKVNTMTSACISKLGFLVYYTNIGAQKIDGSTFKIFKIVLASFQINDNFTKTQFF